MMTNIKIELTDEQRVHLQQQLTGKKRPLSRQELSSFVSGIIEGALKCEDMVVDKPTPCFTPSSTLDTIPPKYAEQYAGKPDAWRAGWLIGWNKVGERVR